MNLETWEKIAPGRYHAELNGHTLQVIRNPDWQDSRRYIPVVDKRPISEPYSSLSAAKLKATRHAMELASERAIRNGRAHPAPEPMPEPMPPPPEPEALAGGDGLGEVFADFEEVAPAEPLMLEAPAPEPEASRLSIDLSGVTITSDAAASIDAIRAAVDLLRGIPGAQDVRCRIHLPHPWIDL